MITLESSLRKRAIRAKRLALTWLFVAIILLVGICVYMPFASVTLLSRIKMFQVKVSAVEIATSNLTFKRPETKENIINRIEHPEMFTLVVMFFILLLSSLTGYLIGRSAFQEMMAAMRWNGIADAASIAGDNFPVFEKAVAIMVPTSRGMFGTDVISAGDMKLLTDFIKSIRGR